MVFLNQLQVFTAFQSLFSGEFCWFQKPAHIYVLSDSNEVSTPPKAWINCIYLALSVLLLGCPTPCILTPSALCDLSRVYPAFAQQYPRQSPANPLRQQVQTMDGSLGQKSLHWAAILDVFFCPLIESLITSRPQSWTPDWLTYRTIPHLDRRARPHIASVHWLNVETCHPCHANFMQCERSFTLAPTYIGDQCHAQGLFWHMGRQDGNQTWNLPLKVWPLYLWTTGKNVLLGLFHH